MAQKISSTKRVRGEVPVHEGASRSAPSLSERNRIHGLFQAEIEKLRPHKDTRRAAILIGQSSIKLTEEPSSPGYVIVGSDGRPRMSVTDGRPAPFTLEELAVELRETFPTLFKPPMRARASAGQAHLAPALRDWLTIGSDRPEPRIVQEAHGPSRTVDAPRHRTAAGEASEPAEILDRSIELQERIRLAGSRENSVADFGPIAGRTPYRFVLYAGLAVLIGAGSMLVFTISGSKDRPSLGFSQQATPVAAPKSELIPKIPAGRDIEPGLDHEAARATETTASIRPRAGSLGAAQSPAITGVPDVIDTATLRIDKKVVPLFGVEWTRGGQAGELTGYLSGREVVCTKTDGSDRYRCRVEGRDLSEVILYNGGGRATPDATPELKAAEARARASGIGVWQRP